MNYDDIFGVHSGCNVYIIWY